MLTEFLWWTVVDSSRIKSDMCNMYGTDRTGVVGFGRDAPGRDSVSWNSWGSCVTLTSAGLYDPDVLGFRAREPESAVVKVMSIPDNRCIKILIPDENVGRG